VSLDIATSLRQGSMEFARLAGMQILEIGFWVAASINDMNPNNINSVKNTSKWLVNEVDAQHTQLIRSYICFTPDLSLSAASPKAVLRLLLSHCITLLC
jgi:hypothetical protein